MEKKDECNIMLFSFSGCIAFIGVAAYFLTRPSIEITMAGEGSLLRFLRRCHIVYGVFRSSSIQCTVTRNELGNFLTSTQCIYIFVIN